MVTQDKLLKWGLTNSMSCVFCRASVEDRNHLFFGCQFTAGIWLRILGLCGYSRMPRNWENEFLWVIAAKVKSFCSITRKIAWGATIYHLWGHRNSRIQENNYATISDDGGTSNVVTTFDDAVMVSIPPIQPIPRHGRYVSASILLNRPAAPKFGRKYLVRSNGHVRGVPNKGPSWTSIVDAKSGDDGFVVTTAAVGVIPVVVDGVNDAGRPKFISYLAGKYRKADFAGSRVLKKGPSRGWVTKNSSRADSCNSYADLHVSVQTVTSFRLGSGLVELVLPHIRADLATAALLDLARAISEVMPKLWVLVPVWYYLVLI